MQMKVKNQVGSGTTSRARASTKTILGLATRKPRINPKWAKHYESLTKLREEVLAKKQALAQDVNAKSENSLSGEHLADAATDSYDRDWALTMLSSGQNAFYEIEEALARIKQGTYGICELTGKRIESDRLRAIPWTRFSAAAQKELEAKGAVGRVHLGELGEFHDTGEAEETGDEDAEPAQAVAERTGAAK